ncbi:mevalonate kinase-like protein [Dinothrombium tinctorium]|uniref:Mevalonate kinase n=1 Tax=Dinothrombium tinctorium TaxID=1965070 RepID=A0A3S3QRR2_9ACAR|nr:mevalonate kinase-like protein [Dinothrombium tinctorium]RWS12956.1 mevalonate kinase-like protein [Dinothrombium tinctorium]
MAKVISSSAPGKVILHGEHAVVFGKNAVAVSVDLKTTVEIKSDPNSAFVMLNLIDFKCETKWPLTDFVEFGIEHPSCSLEFSDDISLKFEKMLKNASRKEAIDSICAFLFLYFGLSDKYCKSKRIPLNVYVSSLLPVGAGLGSSAAFSVSLTGALVKIFDLEESLDFISQTAYQVERIFHGRPSGIDNSICTYGGAILFKNGTIQEHVKRSNLIPIILVYTNVPRNTKKLVKLTSDRKQKYADVVNNIMNAIDSISLMAWKYIKGENVSYEIETLVEMNQHLLNSIGAGHSSIDRVVNIAKNYEFQAKLTGAGGGGTVIIHLPRGNPSQAFVRFD